MSTERYCYGPQVHLCPVQEWANTTSMLSKVWHFGDLGLRSCLIKIDAFAFPSFFLFSPTLFNLDSSKIISFISPRLSPHTLQVGGAANCLSVVAGVTSLVVQGSTHKDIMSWAAHLYQVQWQEAFLGDRGFQDRTTVARTL